MPTWTDLALIVGWLLTVTGLEDLAARVLGSDRDPRNYATRAAVRASERLPRRFF